MKRKIKLLLLLILLSVFTTACTNDDMDNIKILVTNYSNEYLIKEIYGDHSTITSVYPDGITIEDYNFNKKQKNDFANYDLFIYNGLVEKERSLAMDLLDINPNLKIIDTAYVLKTDYSPEELWLNPSSLLMMAQNIRLGLNEYITSSYLKKEVDTKYEELKVTLSELDANYRVAVENTNDKNIIVGNSALKYLEKFGLNVICLDNDATDKTIATAQDLVNEKQISYIIIFKNQNLPDNATKFLEENNSIKKIELHKLDNLTDTERSEKKNYETITNENLDLLKQELYQ